MAKRIIVLSGPIASGKTALGDMLIGRFGFVRFKTRQLLVSMGIDVERSALQGAGENLDRRTGGRWVSLALAREVVKLDDDATVIVDAARIIPQVKAIREAFGPIVVHVHLTAPLS